jgi:hypothetical protein
MALASEPGVQSEKLTPPTYQKTHPQLLTANTVSDGFFAPGEHHVTVSDLRVRDFPRYLQLGSKRRLKGALTLRRKAGWFEAPNGFRKERAG